MNKLFLSGVVEVEDDFTPGDCELCALTYPDDFYNELRCLIECNRSHCPITIDQNKPGILYLDVT